MEAAYRRIHLLISFFTRLGTRAGIGVMLFCVLFAMGYYHAVNGGVNLTDEGMYVSTPLRYRFGDVPFKNEVITATRPFDLLVAPLYWFFPTLTLLQLRIIGLSVDLLSILSLYFLFATIGPPLLVALICTVVFFFNNFGGILSPSYNLLASSFSTIAFVWLLWAYTSEKRWRIVFAGISGIFFYLAVVSYLSVGILLVLPICVFVGAFGRTSLRRFLFPTGVFLATVGELFLVSAFVLAVTRLLGAFIFAFLDEARAAALSSFGLLATLTRLFRETKAGFWQAVCLSFGLVGASAVVRFAGKEQQRIIHWTSVALLIVVFTFMSVFVFSSMPFVIVVLSVLLIISPLFSLANGSDQWKLVAFFSCLWSLILMTIYGVFSSMGLAATLKGIAPLLIVDVLAFLQLTESPMKRRILSWVFAAAFLLLSIVGAKEFIYTVYLDQAPNKLTAAFHYPKLAGIQSTPDKVAALELLLAYLKDRVHPGDYFLAFNDTPLLYFLTDTRPSYGSVWAADSWWSVARRERLFRQMIEQKREPTYAVRMVTNPGFGWVTPVAAGVMSGVKAPIVCFLCDYVEKNYVLEKMIFPFEIWRRDKGEKFELLQSLNLLYEDRFETWQKGTFLIPSGKLVEQTPLWVETLNGQYSVTVRGERGERIVRLDYKGDPRGRRSGLDLGFSSERKGFSFSPQEGEEVALTATVRLSGYRPLYPYYSAILYMQDRTNVESAITNEENTRTVPPLVHKDSQFWKTNSVAIDKPEWKEYVVTRKLRDGATNLNFGITWVPLQAGDWIELKNIRFYSNKKDKQPIP